MADLALTFRQPHPIGLHAPFRLVARLRLLRRNMRHELFCAGMDDRTLEDVGLPRRPNYDWLWALMHR